MLLENHNAIEVGGYAISNSLRFQSASSTWMSRTPSSAGTSNKVMTFSAWVKRGAFATLNGLFTGSGGTVDGIQFWNNNIDVFFNNGATRITTSAVYRDPSSWYHIVVSVDTTQATAANRVRIYVNGSQVTSTTGTNPAQNYVFSWNQNNQQRFGTDGGSNFFDGYTAEVNVIDGQALTPSSFGETDTTTGQWIAKKYTGTYGSNGFYLPFSNGTSTTTLGADSSGNSNNWTLNNFTRSAGASDCWMIDVPSGNGGASGTQPSSNYCVLNPLMGSAPSLSNANLTTAGAGSTNKSWAGTVAANTSKWYFEYQYVTAPSTNGGGGIWDVNSTYAVNNIPDVGTGTRYTPTNGNISKFVNGASTLIGTYATYTTNDVIGVAFDCDAGTVSYYKNNVLQVTITEANFVSKSFTAAIYTFTGNVAFNFGQRSFAYTPPTGFKALCTANLPAATIKKGNQFMDVLTYTGTGGTRTLTGLNFQPDMVWSKSRSSTLNHTIIDAVRGVGSSVSSKSLVTNNTEAESWSSANFGYLSSFNNNGVTYTAGSSNNDQYNQNTVTYVQWNWNAGGSTVTNTSGSISSQVRANPTAGVSIATFTAGSGNYTVGHGLGVAPSMTIVKRRDSATGGNWWTWNIGLGNNTTDYLALNSTDAEGSAANMWGSVGRNSTVSGFNGTASTVAGGTFVMYNFSEIAGFSKFGSYTGNGSADGPFVYTGFQPKFILIKQSSGSGTSWVMYDSVRSTYNVVDKLLLADTSGAEVTATSIDILSNGFKLRSTDGSRNSNGATYIYAAFATNPFQNSNAF